MRLPLKLFCFLPLIFLLACNKKGSNTVPAIFSVTPAMEGPGAIITISGAGFGDSTSASGTTINGTKAELISFNDTEIRARIPENASSGKVQITGKNGSTGTIDNFTVLTGRWKRKADYPGTPVGEAIAFTINGKGYFGTGYDGGGPRAEFYEYDPATNAWKKLSSLPDGGRFRATSFVLNNKGYVVTGNSAAGSEKKTWEYDPSLDKWTQKADFPGVARDGALSFTIGSKAYVGGGAGHSPSIKLSDWWEYNPANDQWIRKADYPTTTIAYGVVMTNNNWAKVGFGNSGEWLEYNPAQDKWSQKTPFTGALALQPAYFTIGANGYFIAPNIQFCWQFVEMWNSWLPKTSLPNKTIAASGFSIGNKGYIVGGNADNVPAFQNSALWEFDPQE